MVIFGWVHVVMQAEITTSYAFRILIYISLSTRDCQKQTSNNNWVVVGQFCLCSTIILYHNLFNCDKSSASHLLLYTDRSVLIKYYLQHNHFIMLHVHMSCLIVTKAKQPVCYCTLIDNEMANLWKICLSVVDLTKKYWMSTLDVSWCSFSYSNVLAKFEELFP